MVTKNFLSTLIAALSLALVLTACKSAPKVSVPNPIIIPPPLPPISNVPVDKPEEKSAQPVPPPVAHETKRVALILGPGGAKTLAHVGVLKALQQQRVPVGKVVGLEWGALMAALYANKGQVHDVEWKLYKMEQQNLPMPKGFFPRRSDGSVKMLEGYFSDVFGGDDISAGRVSFSCPARSVWSGVVTWQNRGSFKDAMKRCLNYPPVLSVQGNFIAGASQATEAVEQLSKEGYNIIIFVNVLGSGLPVAQDAVMENVNQVILWQEVKRALSEASKMNIVTINVDTSAYTMVQFEAKKELIQLGEAIGQRAAYELVSKYGF